MKIQFRFAGLIVAAASALLGASCKSTPEPDAPKTAATTPDKPKNKKIVTTMHDQNGDVAFQGFLNRLRQAVATKDTTAIAGMMTANFGYHINPDKEGEGVFAYWDQNNIWPELQLVIRERFVPFGELNGGFMVAPAEFATAENYTGYRAGIQLVNGSWKFSYFVNGSDPGAQ